MQVPFIFISADWKRAELIRKTVDVSFCSSVKMVSTFHIYENLVFETLN